MADQSTRITNFPDSGSPERVAFDMMKWLHNLIEKPQGKEALKDAYLDLYSECLEASRGYRKAKK